MISFFGKNILILFFPLILIGCERAQPACVHSTNFCKTSFVAIISNREELIGQEIGFEGIPRKVGEKYYVYMDVESARYADQAYAVELLLDDIEGVEDDLEYLEMKRSAFLGVMVRSTDDSWAKLRLLKEPGQAAIKAGPHDLPPPPPPES
ncbi:MAG: hypothetical protein KF800_13445 [Lysobacter sp.]|nr:hypothetical protein [Lysobacter sp.]